MSTTGKKKESALVICPGRGTYTPAELGYLGKYHKDKKALLDRIDGVRTQNRQQTVRDLDAEASWKASVHATSENASPLIHACAMADFADIDRERYDIVAVTGNSMGWYLALACAGALDEDGGITVVNTMGTLMERQGTGGQIVYPLTDEDWRADATRQTAVARVLAEAQTTEGLELHVSISLGGMIVLAGNDAGLDFAMKALPKADRFPMKLAYHAAFHTSLLAHIPEQARAALKPDLFSRPDCALIDGRGAIWTPWSTDLAALHAYTFGAQIETPYDFSKAVTVAVKEFAPERIILLGPGTTMGAPVAQVLIDLGWWGLDGKQAFARRQAEDPVILSMGISDQRAIATGEKAAA